MNIDRVSDRCPTCVTKQRQIEAAEAAYEEIMALLNRVCVNASMHPELRMAIDAFIVNQEMDDG